MNAIDLKEELRERISEIDDIEFLNAIKSVLDCKKTEAFIMLTEDQVNELTLASEEGRKGNYFTRDEMDAKVKAWLEEM